MIHSSCNVRLSRRPTVSASRHAGELRVLPIATGIGCFFALRAFPSCRDGAVKPLRNPKNPAISWCACEDSGRFRCHACPARSPLSRHEVPFLMRLRCRIWQQRVRAGGASLSGLMSFRVADAAYHAEVARLGQEHGVMVR